MSSHSGNLNYCLVVDGLYRNNKGGKRVIFRAVSLFAGLLPRDLFWDNNKDVISNNLAILKLMLLELDEAGVLFLSLKGLYTPQCCSDCKAI